MLILGELLEQADFGLQLLTGSPRALERPVAGAHNSETPEPWQFLGPDWVMLTLGLQLRRNPNEQRALIRQLVERDVCALGFGVGVAFQQVPRALLDEAERLDFPVFRIPYETPYRDIVGFVNRSLLSVDFSLLQRSLSMQNYLIGTLRSQHPITALVSGLGQLLGSTVLLLDPEGSLVAGETDVSLEVIWTEICSHPHEMHRSTLYEREIVNMPLGSRENPDGWLVVINPSQALPRELVLSVVQSAERLLDVVSLGRRAVAAEERVVRAELLASALDDSPETTLASLTPRLRRFGFTQRGTCRVVTLAPRNGESPDVLDRLRRDGEQLLDQLCVPYLAIAKPPYLIALVEADTTAIREWLEQLECHYPSIVAGVGRAVDKSVSIARSHQESQIAMRHRSGSVRAFDDLGLVSWLVSSGSRADFEKKIDELLSPLREQPQLIETLSAYIMTGMSVSEAAKRLQIHTNTLRYRLGRIERALGRSFDDFATAVDLYLAIVAADMPDSTAPS